MTKKKLKLVPGRWTRFEYDPFTELIPDELFQESGNYAIFVDGELNYIGQSENIQTRLSELKLAVGFSTKSRMEIAVRVESGKEKKKLEEKLIGRLKPKANMRISAVYNEGLRLIQELREVIEDRGLSYSAMSKFIGCHERHLSRWLKGQSYPSRVYQMLIKKGIKRARK